MAIDREFGRDFAMAAIPSGFALYGAGVAQGTRNPAAGAALAQFGEGLADMFQKRWWKKEAEIFQQRYAAPYQETVQQALKKWEKDAQEIVARKVDPSDERAVQKQQRDYMKSRFDFINAVNSASNQLLVATTKYPTNPLVAQISDNIQNAYLNWADQLTGAMAEGAALQQRNLDMAVQRRELEGMPSGEEARADRQSVLDVRAAEVRRSDAAAALDRARIGEVGLMGADPVRALDAVMGSDVHAAAVSRSHQELMSLQQNEELRGIIGDEDPTELQRMADTMGTRAAVIDYMRSKDPNLSEAGADLKMYIRGGLPASYSFLGEMQKRYDMSLDEAQRILNQNNWNLLGAMKQAEQEYPDSASQRNKQLEQRQKRIQQLQKEIRILERAVGAGQGLGVPLLKGEELRKANQALKRKRRELNELNPGLLDRLSDWASEAFESREEAAKKAKGLIK